MSSAEMERALYELLEARDIDVKSPSETPRFVQAARRMGALFVEHDRLAAEHAALKEGTNYLEDFEICTSASLALMKERDRLAAEHAALVAAVRKLHDEGMEFRNYIEDNTRERKVIAGIYRVDHAMMNAVMDALPKESR